MSAYNTKCGKCGADAYQGLGPVKCSNSSCEDAEAPKPGEIRYITTPWGRTPAAFRGPPEPTDDLIDGDIYVDMTNLEPYSYDSVAKRWISWRKTYP